MNMEQKQRWTFHALQVAVMDETVFLRRAIERCGIDHNFTNEKRETLDARKHMLFIYCLFMGLTSPFLTETQTKILADKYLTSRQIE